MAGKAEIILVGAAGRVGGEIIGYAMQTRVANLYAGVDHKGRSQVSSIDRVKPIKNAVVVDFSSPSSFRRALAWCVKTKTPLVSGTTGLSPEDMQALKKAGKKIPVLWSANMSRGVNVFLEMIEALGPKLADFDLVLEEVHHSRKKDAPSGTAKILRDKIEESTGKKMPTPLSIRGGGVFGIHKLWLMNDEETLTIEHTALNRRVFARGAVAAANWLLSRRPGLYSVQDMLKKRK